MTGAAIVGNLRDLIVQSGFTRSDATRDMAEHAVIDILDLRVIDDNDRIPRRCGMAVGAQRRRDDPNVAGTARADMTTRRSTACRGLIVIHLTARRTAPRRAVAVAAGAIVGSERVRHTLAARQRGVVASRAGRDACLQVVKRHDWGPVAGFLCMACIAQVAGAQARSVFAALARCARKRTGVAGDAVAEECCVIRARAAPPRDGMAIAAR